LILKKKHGSVEYGQPCIGHEAEIMNYDQMKIFL